MYRERREREKILSRYKKQAEERMAQAERMKRRVSIICCNYIYSNYNTASNEYSNIAYKYVILKALLTVCEVHRRLQLAW